MMPVKHLDPLQKIQLWWGVFQDGVRSSVEAALAIGEILCAQKAALPHGAFLPWLRENVSFISESTCERWMRLHRNRGLLKSVSVTDLTTAYRLLEEPRDDTDDVHDDAVERDEAVVGDLLEDDAGDELVVELPDDDDEDEADDAEAEQNRGPVPAVRRTSAPRPVNRRPLLPVGHAMKYASLAISQLESIRRDDPERNAAFDRVVRWIDEEKR